MKEILIKSERGSVLIIVALAMVVLLGFATLAVDGGYLYSRHTRLQDVADSVALAAAMEVAETNSKAQKPAKGFDKAIEYVSKNEQNAVVHESGDYKADIVFGNKEQGHLAVAFLEDAKGEIQDVKVDIWTDAHSFFSRVLQSSPSRVATSATARIGQASQQSGKLIPINAVDDPKIPGDFNYAYGQRVEMTLGPGGGSSGNFGWLNFDTVTNVGDYIRDGYNGTLSIHDKVDTKTGVSVGVVAAALGTRLSRCSGDFSTYVDSETKPPVQEIPVDEIKAHLESEPECSRLVYVPITNSIGDKGTGQVEIIGFSAFFLKTYKHVGDDITLVGYFIEKLDASKAAELFSSTTTRSVRLIK